MTMQPDRIDALREAVKEVRSNNQSLASLLEPKALDAIMESVAAYLEGADILPEKYSYTDQTLESAMTIINARNQAIDTTAANLASVIKSLKGEKDA